MNQNFHRKCFLVLFTILVTIIPLPLFVSFVVVPLVIWRLFVIQLAKYFRNDLLRPTSLFTGFFALDNMYEKPRCTMTAILHFNGSISVSEVERRVEEVVVSGKRPELQCCLDRWMGNFFLKKSENFYLENHLIVNNASTQSEYEDVIEQLVSKPWERNKPFWELHIFPNLNIPALGTSSCITVRVHHTLMDGVSGHCFIKDICDPDPENDKEITECLKKLKDKYTPSVLMKIFAALYLLFIAPFTTVYRLLEATESNIWTVKEADQTGRSSSYVSMNELDLNWLKEIGKKVGKNVTVLLTEAFSAAIRAHFLESSEKNKIYRDIHGVYILPRPGHPGEHKLTNHFMFEFLLFPISEPDRKKRMNNISGQFRNMMTTPQPLATYMFSLMSALLSTIANKHVNFACFGDRIGSFMYSNVMFYGRPPKFSGCDIAFVIPQTGLHSSDNCVSITTASYNEKVSITMRADNKVFQDKQRCKSFIDSVIKELHVIYNENDTLYNQGEVI